MATRQMKAVRWPFEFMHCTYGDHILFFFTDVSYYLIIRHSKQDRWDISPENQEDY